MASEWASYTDDILSALAPLGVQLAVAPLAPGGAAVCQCTTGPTYGRAGSSGGSGQVEYLRLALAQRPGLFSKATYFAAHAYPTNCNAALDDTGNRPKDMGGNASWMSSVKTTRQLATISWASNASHKPSAAAAAAEFRMLITETGWCGGGAQRENQKAQWIAEAYTKLWNPDPVVAAVIPFLLAGHHWDPMGFTWTQFAGAAWDQLSQVMPQYLAVQRLANAGAPQPTVLKSDDVNLPYPLHISQGPARPLLYKTLGLVDANQSLRDAANGSVKMGTAVGEGYVTPAHPSSDEPICQRKCAQAGGCTVGSMPHALCGCAPDGAKVTLNCASGTITGTTFAAVGTPTGTCGNFSCGKCTGDPTLAKAYVAKQCVGKSSCTLSADIKTFNSGKDPCFGVAKSVAVEVTCSMPQPPPPPPTPPEQSPSGMNPYPANVLPKWKEGIHTAATYRAVAEREYDLTSPENACKMDATEPDAGQFSWTGCDLLANFTNLSMNASYFGTTVVWGIALPPWISHGHFNRSELKAHMVEHIRGIMARYNSGPLEMESMVLVNEAASNQLQLGAPEDGMWKGM